MQITSYMPLRQNKMTFRGEETKPAEKSLSKQLVELDDRINGGGGSS